MRPITSRTIINEYSNANFSLGDLHHTNEDDCFADSKVEDSKEADYGHRKEGQEQVGR